MSLRCGEFAPSRNPSFAHFVLPYHSRILLDLQSIALVPLLLCPPGVLPCMTIPSFPPLSSLLTVLPGVSLSSPGSASIPRRPVLLRSLPRRRAPPLLLRLFRATTIRLHLFCSRRCPPLPSVVPRHGNIRHLSAERVRDPSVFSPRTIVCAASLSSVRRRTPHPAAHSAV
ncbi:hypothetical protein B0H14DRAFT_237260 [Mycena olivaceomarginata]|nr:hypothetical protein B0H14DRAFT_237260 [Mycena olivaceomarginata]